MSIKYYDRPGPWNNWAGIDRKLLAQFAKEASARFREMARHRYYTRSDRKYIENIHIQNCVNLLQK